MKQKNLETSSFSLREEIEKIKSLPEDQRLDYLWTYYKATAFIALACLIVAWMVISFAVSAFVGTFFPKAPISIAFAAHSWEDAAIETWVADCKEAIGYDEKEEDLQILTSTGISDYNDSFVINCTCWLAAGQPDIFLCNQPTLDYLLGQQVLIDLSGVEALDVDGTEVYALEVSGETWGIPDEPLYLCMYINGSGHDRALDIVQYILSE